MPRRLPTLIVATLVAAVTTIGLSGAPAHAATYTPITGEGSSWAANAIDNWRVAVNKNYTVNFFPTGSVAGLTGFGQANSDDFAISDVPYGVTNVSPDPPERAFAYIPSVAGGIGLSYNLTVNGQRFTNLKLSGATIAGIFAGSITTWNDPKIAADNPGVALPSLKVTPVVRSDSSGSTATFTDWMSKKFGSVWTCGQLSFFTQCADYSPAVQQAKPGNNGVANFVAQAGNAGSIGYVDYSYALQLKFPVAKVLNPGGYYVLPTASNVAVALQKASLDSTPGPSYLTVKLDGVYANTDPRSYPISSVSYFVVPTQLQNGFTTDKGYTLSSFVNYALCAGQAVAPPLGYAPLPMNLVQAGLDQVRNIPGAVAASTDISKCDNPTFSSTGENLLAKSAPYPDTCDKATAPANCAYGTPSGGSPISDPVQVTPVANAGCLLADAASRIASSAAKAAGARTAAALRLVNRTSSMRAVRPAVRAHAKVVKATKALAAAKSKHARQQAKKRLRIAKKVYAVALRKAGKASKLYVAAQSAYDAAATDLADLSAAAAEAALAKAVACA